MARLNIVLVSLRNDWNVRSLAAGVAPINSQPWSRPSSDCSEATIARSWRRRRLRRVAVPTERPTAKATRSGTTAGSLRKVHHRDSLLAVRPERASVWKVRRWRMLQIKPTAGYGP